MRFVGRMFVLFFIVSLLVLLIGRYLPSLYSIGDSLDSSYDDAKASTYYLLKSDQWISYKINPSEREYRFHFHAGYTKNEEHSQFGFVVEYQWVDDDSQVIEQKTYAVTVRNTPMIEKIVEGEKIKKASLFYPIDSLTPSTGQWVYLSAPRDKKLTEVQFRIKTMDASIRQIGIRGYKKQRRDDDLDVIWQRMSDSKKAIVAKPSIYPHYLLSKFERNNALSGFWMPMGPRGVVNKDYEQDTLYIRSDGVRWQETAMATLDGHISTPKHTVSFVIPSEGNYRIKFDSLDSTQQLTASLLWQSNDYQNTKNHSFTVNASGYWENLFSPGLIELTTNKPGGIRLFHLADDSWEDVTPQRRYAPAYTCHGNKSLQFALEPGYSIQPLQIVGRAYHREDEAVTTTRLRGFDYVIKNKQGKVLLKETVSASTILDSYRQFADLNKVDSYINEPVRRYVNAPASAAYLQLKCSGHTLISLYSRPKTLPVTRTSKIQSDNPWLRREQTIPTWFSVTPMFSSSEEQANRQASLVWYSRSVMLNEAILTGNYDWQWMYLKDVSFPIEKQILTAYETDTEVKRSALKFSYQQVGNQPLEFASNVGQDLVRPELIYHRLDPDVDKVMFYLDSQPFYEARLGAEVGRIKLPAVSVGRRKLTVSPADAAQWFVNYTVGDQLPMVLRSAYLVDKKEARFNLELEGADKQLSIWLYMPEQQESSRSSIECKVDVDVEQPSVVSDHRVFDHYIYSFNTNQAATAFALQSNEGRYKGPFRMSVNIKHITSKSGTATISCNESDWLASVGVIEEGARQYELYENVVEYPDE